MSDLITKINTLRREKNAVILAHTYQPAEIQDIADYVGDSYGLSVEASKLDKADLIVFCGVLFMAETAAILNPERKVIMPDPDAGCPMADMITGEQLRQFKAKHPGAKVVCYVNSTAEIKAESDVCCTSSNAVKIVSSLGPDCDILFVPDQFLGKFVEQKLGRKLILWDGYCPVHEQLTGEVTRKVKARYPGVPLMVHPETRPEVQQAAEFVLSTGQMLTLVQQSQEKKFLVGTEEGILHALRKAAPDKEFIHLSGCLLCQDMKKNTLKKVLHSLETEQTVITVPSEIALRARQSIEAMIALSQA
ncbi:MAG: quinolinate synthase NadA [Lentisphaeria bacterium]